MSKKNKRKFYTSPASSVLSADQSGLSSAPTSITSSSSSISSEPSTSFGDSHAEEYRVIKQDLIKVVVLNILFLAGVLTLYYTNLQTHYLDNWFNSLIKF